MPASAISSTGRQSKKLRGVVARRQAAIARSFTHAMASPGGSIRPFWLPQTATVDAPLVEAEVHARQPADGVHHQQRRVARGVDGGADRGHVRRHAGRGLVVHDRDRPDGVRPVRGQPVVDQLARTASPSGIATSSTSAPSWRPKAGVELAERAVREAEQLLAGADHVDQRALHRPRAGAGGQDDLPARRPEHPAEARPQLGQQRRHVLRRGG